MLATVQLREWAARRGLVLGIAPAGPFSRGEAALKWRVEQGLATPFAAGSLEERCRPGVLYPGARSLVVVAGPHPRPAAGAPGPGRGRVARYAMGPDYHRLLRGHLQGLAGILCQAGASLAAVQVDNGPLLEREAACLAGLGYYGASCNLIIPGLGTAFALGLVVTDLELEPGKPLAPATCRNCGRCLAACPTGALLAPGRLDPQRCLSYLTQKRGLIPPELRPAMGSYIWGCDVCQEVCPENYRAGEPPSLPETGLLPTGLSWPGVGDKAGSLTGGAFRLHSDRVAPHLTYPELATIITLDRAGFNQIFGSTALAWRGKTVLQRNAAIALGNQGDPAALVPLQQALHAPAAILRAHAAWALGRLGATGHPALAAALATEADAIVRREIKEALEGRCSRQPL